MALNYQKFKKSLQSAKEERLNVILKRESN